MENDAALLLRYVRDRAEDAFAEIVRRHLNFVFQTALRQVGGDAHYASDVAQYVFTEVARKAESLVHHRVLKGWLFTTACHSAANIVRSERRRHRREQEAHAMQNLESKPGSPDDWTEVRPLINDALTALSARDREAVLLRYFEGRDYAEIGTRFSVTADAARLRVERALEKMRMVLSRAGVTSGTAALASTLTAQAVTVAPAGLAASVTGAALAGAAASGGASGLGVFLTMSKIKVGIVSGIVLALAATGVVELRANRGLRAELSTLEVGGENIVQLRRENKSLISSLAKMGEKNPEADELVRLRTRAAVLKARPTGVTDETLKPVTAWRNVGRATPEAANETFHWSLAAGDLDAAASVVVFSDDTPENREKFMAHFSDALRAKYRTPERLLAAAVFGAGEKTEASAAWRPDDAFQVIGSDDHVGADGLRFGQVRLRVWYRTATGEREGGGRWQSTPEGWAMGSFYLTSGARQSDNALAAVLGQINPMTGERLRARP